RDDVFNRTVEVPYPPESAASGIGDTSFHPVVWYRRVFDLNPDDIGRRIILHFGAVDYLVSPHNRDMAAGMAGSGRLGIYRVAALDSARRSRVADAPGRARGTSRRRRPCCGPARGERHVSI